MMEKKDIKSLTLEELKAEMAALGEKPFRAAQLYEWMHRKLARGYEEMSNIPAAMKAKCGESYRYTALHVAAVQESAIDGTKKYLFALAIRSVFLLRWDAAWDAASAPLRWTDL